jgi:hypothetical protein
MPPGSAPLAGLSGGPEGLQIIDPVLSNVARQFRPHGFVYGDIVAPQPVEYNVGQYPIFDLAKFFSARGDARVADDAATPIVDFKWSTEYYNCEDFRLRTRLTRKEKLQAHPALRLEMSKTVGLLGIMALEREIRLAKKLRSTENGGQFTQAYMAVEGAKWDEGTSGSPAKIQKTLITAGQKVYKTTGRRPNTLVITEEIALAISQDPAIIEIVKYLIGPGFVASGSIADDRLIDINSTGVIPKKLFGFNVIVADGVLENTAQEGATPTLSEVWGNSARLMYIDTDAAWGIPTVAYSFRGRVTAPMETAPESPTAPGPGPITQLEPEGQGDWAIVDRWQEPDPPAENIRAWECVDEHVVAPELGIEIGPILGNP